jgi:hypothetical protein
MLGEERIPHIVGQPLMETAWPVAIPILRAFVFELVQEPRAEPLIDEVPGVIGDDALAVLAHAWPCPALEPVNILINSTGDECSRVDRTVLHINMLGGMLG